MKQVKLYGTRSSSYEYFKYYLVRELKNLGITLNLEEINNLDLIIEDKVASIPSIKIGHQKILSYENGTSINGFLHTSLQALLKEYDYGSMKRILVPFDFSDNAISALEYAKELATKLKAHITVRHYIHPTLSDNEDSEKQKLKELNFLIEPNIVLSNHGWSDLYIDTDVKSGLAGDQLITDSQEFDLIVMGNKGLSNRLSQFFGSASKKAMNKANCPVLLIPEDNDKFTFENIMYPAKSAIKRYKSIEWIISRLKSKLHVVHFDTTELHSPMIQEILPKDAALLSDELTLVLKYVNDQTLNVNQGIKSYIEDNDIDLIILEKGKKKIGDVLLDQSVSNKLIRKAEIPTLVLNEYQGNDNF